ncbi:hypothetical protein QQX98_012381, partial [Neonectria punicea]
LAKDLKWLESIGTSDGLHRYADIVHRITGSHFILGNLGRPSALMLYPKADGFAFSMLTLCVIVEE